MSYGDASDPFLSPYSQAATKLILEGLETSLGGRTGLLTGLLATPTGDPDLDHVVGLLTDPRNDTRDLASLCAEGGISLGKLLEAFKRGILAPAYAEAMTLVRAAIPAIAADVITRAQVHEDDCPNCFGSGVIENRARREPEDPPSLPCPPCAGSGRVTKSPEFARQKYVLSGMEGFDAGKKAVPAVLIDQSDRRSLTMDVSGEAHQKLLAAADRLLYGSRTLAPEKVPAYTPGDDAPE